MVERAKIVKSVVELSSLHVLIGLAIGLVYVYKMFVNILSFSSCLIKSALSQFSH